MCRARGQAVLGRESLRSGSGRPVRPRGLFKSVGRTNLSWGRPLSAWPSSPPCHPSGQQRTLTLPLGPGALGWMVWTGTPAGLCQQILVDKPPPLSSLSPHGHRKRRPGGFHPALTLLIRLSVEPVCGRGPRKQLGARGRISWGSCWGRAWGGQGSDLRGGFHPAPPGICAERHRRPPPPGRGLQERPRCVRAAPWHSSRHRGRPARSRVTRV